MTATNPFAPLSSEEQQAPRQKKKADKVPIVPVPDDAPAMNFKIPRLGGAPKRVWEYRDREGRLLGYDARFEFEGESGPEKEVLPVTFCQEGDKRVWRAKALPAPRPLYGLDRLAARPDAPIVIAEGCKSADAAGKLLPDHVAMSWSGGSNAIAQSDWSSLKGRTVLIWPDRDRQCDITGTEKPYEDQPGSIAAENILTKIKGVAATIRMLDLSSFVCADGWDADDALEAKWDPARAAAFVAEHAIEIDTAAPGTVVPYGFEYGADGLYFVESDTRRFRICGRLKVLAKTRDVGGSGWGLLLEWRDDDGVQHRWAMPKSMLAGDGSAVREALLERGLFVSTDSKARSRLLEFLSSVDTPIRARAVTRVGWAGAAFALPHLTIGDTPTERVIFQNGDAGPHHYLSAGTLQEWQQEVADQAIGNSRLVFMISAAFVGPVLDPACEEGGGVNFVGPSSCGKTTGLRAAASVWGPPSFMRTWRATGNGLEGVAAQHSETCLCLDELGQLEPREAGGVAYMLGNGQGKTRASRSGSSRMPVTWKVMYLSTGEVGLAALARDTKQGRAPQAGQEVRILDVPADAGKGMGLFERLPPGVTAEQFARQIKTAASTHYGTAATAFIEALVPVHGQVGDMVAKSVAQFVGRYVPRGADGQVERAGRRFGLVAAAGELAIGLGVLRWQAGEANDAAGVMFRAWIRRRGGLGAAEDRNIIKQVNLFLEQHGDSRFSPLHEDDVTGRPVINRAGFYRDRDSGGAREYIFPPESFEDVTRGYELAMVKTVLDAAGLLIRDGQNKFTQSIRLPGIGRKRCYVIRAPSGEDGDDVD